jgi:lincosamide nucleotidyltransferase
MLPQEAMIARLRQSCQKDERVEAALLYGSFPRGEADEFSDIDCVLFVEDDALPALDRRAWVEQIAPVLHLFTNEYGIETVIFDNLIRGEFHFDPASSMDVVETWRDTDWFTRLEDIILVDRTGELSRRLEPLLGPAPRRDRPEQVQAVIDRYLNWLLFGVTVWRRGEMARSLELLWMVQRHLLWMARLIEGATEHWPTPSRGLEQDLSPQAYARYRACTAALDGDALRAAYQAAWRWGREMMTALAQREGVAPPEALLDRLDAHIKTL